MDFHQSVQTATNFLHMARIERNTPPQSDYIMLQINNGAANGAMQRELELKLELRLRLEMKLDTNVGTKRTYRSCFAICYISMYDLCIAFDM